jgi:hypothetical protein
MISLVFAQVLLLMALAGYVSIGMPGEAAATAVMTPLEPPMSRLAGLAP